MALMLAICSAQPNWMPRKPKLMFQICQKPRCGLATPPALAFTSGSPPAMTRSLDEQDSPFVRTQGQRQSPAGVQRAEPPVLDEVGDHAVGRGGLDDDGLANGGAAG